MAASKKPAKMSRKRIVLFVLLSVGAVFVGIALYLFAYEPRYSGPIVRTLNTPLIFAHRGYGEFGPDNSLAASQRAMDAGFDGIDVDGQLTKDGQIVIFHDLSLDRLTAGKGKVGNYTLAELQKLDLAPKYDGTGYDTAPVESFEDFVKNITPRGTLMVELKVTKTGDTGIEREAIRIIKKYDAFDKVYLSSFNPLVIRRLEQLDSRVNSVYIFMDTNWNPQLLAEMNPKDVVNLPWFVQKEWVRRGARKIIKPDMLSVNVAVSKETRQRLLAKGWPIFLWAPDDDAAMKAAIKQNPYGIISDNPVRVRELIKEQSP